jgi:hypoxanthine phosphoribosyltransferase
MKRRGTKSAGPTAKVKRLFQRKRTARSDEVVLAPQTELPRHQLGVDRSTPRSSVHELTWAQFDQLVQGLAKPIRKGFKPEAVVGVAHGGVFVGGALASALGVDFYPVRISRRSRDKVVRSTPKLFGEMPEELDGKRVLLVDDVAASGDTLQLALALAKKAGAKALASACLFARVDGYQPDHVALITDDFVVFPWDYGPVAEDGRFDVDPDKAGA